MLTLTVIFSVLLLNFSPLHTTYVSLCLELAMSNLVSYLCVSIILYYVGLCLPKLPDRME